TEVVRQGIAPKAKPAFNTTSSLARSNDVAIVAEDFSSASFATALKAGTNILAIHAFNRAANDSDFLILPELVARQLRYPTNASRFFSIPTPGFANAPGYPGASRGLQF